MIERASAQDRQIGSDDKTALVMAAISNDTEKTTLDPTSRVTSLTDANCILQNFKDRRAHAAHSDCESLCRYRRQ
jgi:hypothetical protein